MKHYEDMIYKVVFEDGVEMHTDDADAAWSAYDRAIERNEFAKLYKNGIRRV